MAGPPTMTDPEVVTAETGGKGGGGSGEVVYSSDGLAPITITKPPPKIETTRTSLAGDEFILDSDEIPPQYAFEVFQGKIYTKSHENHNAGSSMVYPLLTGSSSNNKRLAETPLERLARLQVEVQDLERDLTTTTSNNGRDFDEQLVELATTLKTKLQTLASSNNNNSAALLPQHDELTRLIQEQLQKTMATTKAPAVTTTTTTSPEPSTGDHHETGVVYELYGNATNPTSTLEDRLIRLERMIGSSSFFSSSSSNNNSNNNNSKTTTTTSKGSTSSNASSTSGGAAKQQTLMHRLEDMEALVRAVDATYMEQTTTKAKVIRADLEAASKARNKLTSSYKKEDSKMIQQLHSQLVDLEGLSGYLPSLVDRLQQLAGLHLQAGTFASRLEALETSTYQLSSSMKQLEDSMEQLTTGMTQNMTVLQTNLKSLDERLDKL